MDFAFCGFVPQRRLALAGDGGLNGVQRGTFAAAVAPTQDHHAPFGGDGDRDVFNRADVFQGDHSMASNSGSNSGSGACTVIV